MPHKPQIYFGASDRQMESFLDREAFDRALVYGLLFHGDLVIPDIFLYISGNLATFAVDDRSGRAFLEASLRAGAVIPAFRSDTRGSFRDNLAEIRREEIQGLHPKADVIAEILEESMRMKRPNYVLWPTQPFSVGYRKTLERTLLSDSLPTGSSSLLERYWEESQELRTAVLGELSQDTLGGYRRGDLYNALARYLGSEAQRIDDIRTLMNGIEDRRRAGVVERFLKLVNYCYHFNHGRMFGLDPSLASLDHLDIEFSRHLARLSLEQSEASHFERGFMFPDVKALLTIDPTMLLDVRDSAVGADYFSALVEWQTSPGEEAAQVLLDRLHRYTSEIRGLFAQHGRSVLNPFWYLRASIPGGRSKWAGLFEEIAGSVVSPLGIVSLVGKLATATYQLLPASAQDALGPVLGMGRRVEVEVEVNMVRVHEHIGPRPTSDVSFK